MEQLSLAPGLDRESDLGSRGDFAGETMENLGGLVPMALNRFLGGLKSSSLVRPQDQQQDSSDLPGFRVDLIKSTAIGNARQQVLGGFGCFLCDFH